MPAVLSKDDLGQPPPPPPPPAPEEPDASDEEEKDKAQALPAELEAKKLGTVAMRSKLDLLVSHLKALRKSNGDAKSLVFTQFTHTRQAVMDRLTVSLLQATCFPNPLCVLYSYFAFSSRASCY